MTVQIACPTPGCDSKYSVADENLGKLCRCKKCGNDFSLVPGSPLELEPIAQPAEPGLPSSFGRYKVLRLLGRGGMGSVYLALDTLFQRQVAIKVPHLHAFADNPGVRKRFFVEAQAAARLHHPNFCPIHDIGEADGVPYLIMAFITGKTLAELIEYNQGWPLVRAAEVIRELALALAKAHREGIIHRDLKPANVMIDADNRIVLMDFGLARWYDFDSSLTPTGAVFGTPAYMSPEQAEGNLKAVGPRSDLYALGVILYELLTGRRPFEGPITKVLGMIAFVEPEPPSKLRPDLDPRLEAVCLKAMAKKPDDRHDSMDQLAGALTAFLNQPPIPPPPRVVAKPPVEPARPAIEPEARRIDKSPDQPRPKSPAQKPKDSPAEAPRPMGQERIGAILDNVSKHQRMPTLRPLQPAALPVSPAVKPKDQPKAAARPIKPTPQPIILWLVWAILLMATIFIYINLYLIEAFEQQSSPLPANPDIRLVSVLDRPTQPSPNPEFKKAELPPVDTSSPIPNPGIKKSDPLPADTSPPVLNPGIKKAAPLSVDNLPPTPNPESRKADPLPADFSKPQEMPDTVLETLPSAPKISEPLIINNLGMKLKLIPAGEFLMGSDASDRDASDDEKVNGQKHRVRITKSFYLGTTEVTVGQFRRFVEKTGLKTDAEKDSRGGIRWNESSATFERDSNYIWRSPGFPQTDDHPVTLVSWNDAVAFCDWLSREEGQTYRLPTEAEWEYSCRAGQRTRYSSGDEAETLATVGNVADATGKVKNPNWLLSIESKDGHVFTAPVGRFLPNAFGLFDMHGNVLEWCSDWYDSAYYSKAPLADPQNLSQAALRVNRGGSWRSSDQYCRSANRTGDTPNGRYSYLGFRVARLLTRS